MPIHQLTILIVLPVTSNVKAEATEDKNRIFADYMHLFSNWHIFNYKCGYL